MIIVILFCLVACLIVNKINHHLVNLERKQEILYYNMFVLQEEIRQEENAYLYC